MADDEKIIHLDEIVAVEKEDIAYLTSDPGGTPSDKKATINNLLKTAVNQRKFDEGTGANTPETGEVTLYAKSDGELWAKNDEGNENGVSGATKFLGDVAMGQFSLQLPATEPSTDQTAVGLIRTVTVDSNSTGTGCPLFLAADGHYDEADADADSTAPCIALALEAGTGSKKALFWGLIRNDAWDWITGPGQASLIYLGTTVGALTQTKPSGEDDIVQPVGYATSDDEMFFQPSMIYIKHA